MHVGQGREHPLHIEYIHIGACLSFIQDTFTEAILSHPRMSLHRKIALVKALGKVIWIQNDLFAKWYVRDGEEYSQDSVKAEIEREGYLHGKKMVDSDDSSLGSDDTSKESVWIWYITTEAFLGCWYGGILLGLTGHSGHKGQWRLIRRDTFLIRTIKNHFSGEISNELTCLQDHMKSNPGF